jgi:hypothetical protein
MGLAQSRHARQEEALTADEHSAARPQILDFRFWILD